MLIFIWLAYVYHKNFFPGFVYYSFELKVTELIYLDQDSEGRLNFSGRSEIAFSKTEIFNYFLLLCESSSYKYLVEVSLRAQWRIQSTIWRGGGAPKIFETEDFYCHAPKICLKFLIWEFFFWFHVQELSEKCIFFPLGGFPLSPLQDLPLLM